MEIEHRKMEGDFELSSQLKLYSMVTGNVFVKSGGFLHLHGMVSRDLVVDEGAQVILHGTVSGDVRNNGGKIETYGTIVGRLHDIAGETYIDRNAAIHTDAV